MNYEDTIPGMVDAQIPKTNWRIVDKMIVNGVEWFYTEEVKNGIYNRVKGQLNQIPANDSEKSELSWLITDEITSKKNYDQIFDAIGDHHGVFSSSDKEAKDAHESILYDVRSSLSEDVLNRNGVSNRILCHYVQDNLGIEKEKTQNFLKTIVESARNGRKDEDNIWTHLFKRDPMKDVMKSILPNDFRINPNKIKQSVLNLIQTGMQNDPKKCYLALRDCAFERTDDGYKYKDGIDPELRECMEYQLAPYKKMAEENGLRFKNGEEFLQYVDSVAQFTLNDPEGEKAVSNYIAAFNAPQEEKQKAENALKDSIYGKAKTAGIFYHESVQNSGLAAILKGYSAEDPKRTYLALRDAVFERTADGYKYKDDIDPGLKERMEYQLAPYKEETKKNGLSFDNNDEFLKYIDSVALSVLDDPAGKKATTNYVATFNSPQEEKQKAEDALKILISSKARTEGFHYHKKVKSIKQGLLKIFSQNSQKKTEPNSQMMAYQNMAKIKNNREV